MAVVAGSLAISPALGGPRDAIPSWAKKFFFTKKETRIKFTPRKASRKAYKKFAKKNNVYSKGETYSKQEVDDKFLRDDSSTRIFVSPQNWVSASGQGGTPQGQVFQFGGYTNLNSTGQADFFAALTLPVQLAGKAVRVDSVELCYDTQGVTLQQVDLFRENASSGVNNGGADPLIADHTPQTDEACRSYSPNLDATLGPNDALTLRVRSSGGGLLQVGRLTFVLSTP